MAQTESCAAGHTHPECLGQRWRPAVRGLREPVDEEGQSQIHNGSSEHIRQPRVRCHVQEEAVGKGPLEPIDRVVAPSTAHGREQQDLVNEVLSEQDLPILQARC